MPPGHRGARPTRLNGRHPWCAAALLLAAALLVVPAASADDPPAMTPAPDGAADTPAITPAPTDADDAPAMTPAPTGVVDIPATIPAPAGAGEDPAAPPAPAGAVDRIETAPAPAGDAGAAGTARAPAPGPKPPKDPNAPPPGTRLDETVIRLLLDTARLGDFRVLDPDRVAADWPEAAFMWANDRSIDRSQDLVYGMMIERPVDTQSDFDRDVRRIVVKWSADCDGKSGVRMDNREILTNGKFARRAAYKCTDSDGALLARGFFVGGENALVGFIHFFTEPGRARGEAADTALYRTFVAIMNE
jgi:hypothetical protein